MSFGNPSKQEYIDKIKKHKFANGDDKYYDFLQSLTIDELKDILVEYDEFYNNFIIVETYSTEKEFVIDKNNYKFKLFLGDILVVESGYSIEQPDEWFNQTYVTLYDLQTIKKFQRNGFAKYFLEQIFKYVKNELKLNIITLIVYKNNYKAVNLYFKTGFEKYNEYDDMIINNSYFTLIKKLQ